MTAAIQRKGSGFFAIVLTIAAAGCALFRLKKALQGPLIFDDSYMFYRYAINIRHGLGMSWNLDGVHTYGETAPLWGLIVVLLSYLPTTAPHALILGSWVCGVCAVVAMAWAVARNAQSRLMMSIGCVLPMVAAPLVLSPIYVANALTGMETMLAVMLAAIYLGFVVGWGNGRSCLLQAAFVGISLFLTRPETALAVLLVPAMFVLLERKRTRDFLMFAAIFLSGVVLDLLICKLYFGTPLPLSFYMKSGHAYEGYHTAWHPLSHALLMFANCGVFLAAIILLTRKSEWRMVASIVLPALVAFAYLCTVTQIMGWQSRYYIPYFAFFAVPALLVIDKRVADRQGGTPGGWIVRRALVVAGAVLVLVCAVLVIRISRAMALLEAIDRKLERRPYVYDPVHVEIAASRPLPWKSWFENIHEIGDVLMGPLPKGATIAASEVGYLGVANLQANVIDVEGLNDNQIALHGFDMDTLLARKPDIIWMPHPDYTYQRGVMLTNPGLLQQYDLFAGVGDYDLALRKESPIRSQIDQQMRVLWNDFYPGYRMEDYLVRSASWTGRKYAPTVEQDKQAKRNGSNFGAQF